MSKASLREVAWDVKHALPNPDQAQLLVGHAFAFVVTDHKIFEIYETGNDVFVQVAKREAFEPVGDDTMWWATVPGESNPHFTDEALEPYRIGDEAEYQSREPVSMMAYVKYGERFEQEYDNDLTQSLTAQGIAVSTWDAS